MDRFKISVSSLSTQDVQHILLWYQEIEPILATKFLSELRKFYERIAINPELYGYFNVNQQIRKIRFKKFPYFILYRIKNKTVRIAGIIHKSRSDEFIKGRYF